MATHKAKITGQRSQGSFLKGQFSRDHVLTFLYLAGRQGFDVRSYEDEAESVTSRAEGGRAWVSSVILRPKIVYGESKQPNVDEVQQLHHQADEQCFIANSVRTVIKVE